jgi:hypothetical protein
MTTTQQFAEKIAEACLPKTRPGAVFISVQPGSYLETSVKTDTSVQFKILVSPLAEFQVYIEVFDAVGGRPFEARCDIHDGVGGLWEFFCYLEDDQTLNVRSMPLMRKIRELKEAVLARLNELGGTVDAISKRLESMGHRANNVGLAEFVAEIFALENVVILMEIHRGQPRPVIRGQRPGSDLMLWIGNSLSPAMIKFMNRELVPT